MRPKQSLHFLAAFTITCSAFTRWVPAPGFGVRFIGFASASEQTECSNPAQVLGDNIDLLTPKQHDLVHTLLGIQQDHLFQDWPVLGVDDDKKLDFISQLQAVNSTYVGGVESYVKKARSLLSSAAAGENPFEGYSPSVPGGEDLIFGDEEFQEMEAKGMKASETLAFVLVAGGLGERLGFSGIKVSLPVELSTGTSFLDMYAAWILELQSRARKSGGDAHLEIPLAIMTSDDTDAATRQLLESENYFGLARTQVTVLKQDKVPALSDNTGRLVTKDRWTLVTKPHGHGDVHHLLQRSGVAAQWAAKGKEWVFFFQDTNPLVVNALVPMLGVSVDRNYDMNSLCVPRRAGESAGAITKLTHRDGHSLTINVEYNQLDPLLRATPGFESGDVNDEATQFSPFPGNVNNILVHLPSYLKTLSGEDSGVIGEFVNPKYVDEGRTKFKKPTRLECMMQDLPKLMVKELDSDPSVGFTVMQRWLTFSPAKNSLAEAAAANQKGAPAGSPASAEAEVYSAFRTMLSTAGGMVIVEGEAQSFGGVEVKLMPSIVLDRHFAITSSDISDKVRGGSISARSSLVVEGSGVVEIKDLKLDGALLIKAVPGAFLSLRGLEVNNQGWEFVSVDVNDKELPEVLRMRGFQLIKHDTTEIIASEPGHWIVGPDGKLTRE